MPAADQDILDWIWPQPPRLKCCWFQAPQAVAEGLYAREGRAGSRVSREIGWSRRLIKCPWPECHGGGRTRENLDPFAAGRRRHSSFSAPQPWRENVTNALEADCALLELNHSKANLIKSAQLDAFTELCERLEEGRVRCLITWSSKVSSRGRAIHRGSGRHRARGLDPGAGRPACPPSARGPRQAARRSGLPCRGGARRRAGLGHGVSACCDYRIATPQAIFGLPETGLGILPGAGGTPSRLSSSVCLRRCAWA